MEIKDYFDFNDLVNRCWSGAKDTLETIGEYDMEDEFMNWLESYYGDEIPTLTEVNDLLWFESEWIFEEIGLDLELEDDDEDEDEEEWDEEDEEE